MVDSESTQAGRAVVMGDSEGRCPSVFVGRSALAVPDAVKKHGFMKEAIGPILGDSHDELCANTRDQRADHFAPRTRRGYGEHPQHRADAGTM